MKNIHTSLFTKKCLNILPPYLIDRYLVPKNELVYKFKLKFLYFHNNKQLNTIIVKKNIEHSIKNNNNLFPISGAKEFFTRKENSVYEIILDNKNSLSFTITLREKNINFLNNLTPKNLNILKIMLLMNLNQVNLMIFLNE